MFLVTFTYTNECFSGENNLETHLVIEIFCMIRVERNINWILFVSPIASCFMKRLWYPLLEKFQITLDIRQI